MTLIQIILVVIGTLLFAFLLDLTFYVIIWLYRYKRPTTDLPEITKMCNLTRWQYVKLKLKEMMNGE